MSYIRLKGLSLTDVELRLFLEYISKKYDLLSYDLQVVKSRIDYHDLTSEDLYELVVSDTRLETASSIFRELRELLLIK